ncbi:hypothetical protein ACIRRA_16210 [Nocardia sp. NPDC101769]|uniref:hypothetical protein n=1 Tax=Nocardia sp. NPDC101769 TaxID=3364333 RepID=UPI003830471C
MWYTVLLSALVGVMGANALPHFIKGLVGEEFPNILGNSPLRNALAGWLGLILTGLLIYAADLLAHPWPDAVGICAGALVMAVFHGRGGAYRLNEVLGLPNPPRQVAA